MSDKLLERQQNNEGKKRVEADQDSHKTHPFESNRTVWQDKGCALADIENWGMAHDAFEIATRNLLQAAPIDAALAACDHVRLLLASQKLEEARMRVAEMRSLMEPLAGNVVASAAVRDLVRCEQEGMRLTTSLILRITKRVEESRRADARRPS